MSGDLRTIYTTGKASPNPRMAEATPTAEPDYGIHTKTYKAFEANVRELSSNLYSIAKDGAEGPDGKGGDEQIAKLPGTIGIIENWLLNIFSKQDLLMGYVKRVYVNKKAIDEGNGDILIDDEEYFYGDAPFARPYAPLFTRIWKKHMRKDEKPRAINFFRTYNAIIEDWVADGALNLFDKETREFDYNVIRRIGNSLKKLDRVPEEDLANSKEMKDHYKLLAIIREEFLDLRKNIDESSEEDSEEDIPKKTTSANASTSKLASSASKTTSESASRTTSESTNKTSSKVGATSKQPAKQPVTKEVVKVSVTRHGDDYDVEASDVKVTKGSTSASVTATKVKGTVSASNTTPASSTKKTTQKK